MVRLKRVGSEAHTTIDDELNEELPGWTYIEDRSGTPSSGTLFQDGRAVAFFDRTARYYYLFDSATPVDPGSRSKNVGYTSLLEAIRFYEGHGSFSRQVLRVRTSKE
jgi:hypothetical protein